MEILAPVGGQEQLIAAVRNGANAVYLGTKDFNARRNADNFIDDNTLTVNITRVRNKLGQLGETNVIETKRGQGYIIAE